MATVTSPTILHNRARCLICKDVIESLGVHHYVRCGCGAIAVDGGREYLKRSARTDLDHVEELSEYAVEVEP